MSNLEFTKIALREEEQENINIIAIVTKVDVLSGYQKCNLNEVFWRWVKVNDGTASSVVVFNGEDAKLEINEGDILKVIGGVVEPDNQSPCGYMISIEGKSSFEINPDIDKKYIDILKEKVNDFPCEITKIKDLNPPIRGGLYSLFGTVTKINYSRPRSDYPNRKSYSFNLSDVGGEATFNLLVDSNFKLSVGNTLKIIDGYVLKGVDAYILFPECSEFEINP